MKRIILLLISCSLIIFLSGCVKNQDLIFDKYGYNYRGYDINGFSRQGVHINGTKYDKNGYDANGYDIYGYDEDGFNVKGINKTGLSKQEVLQKKYSYLISEKSTIEKVFNNILYSLRKDEYESLKEYRARINKEIIDTSFILSSNAIKGKYNPETREYIFEISMNIRDLYSVWKYKFSESTKIIKYPEDLNLNNDYVFTQAFNISSNEYTGSNAFGVTVDVQSYKQDVYVIHPINIENILKFNHNVFINLKYSFMPALEIRMKVDKKLAKKYKLDKFAIKINGNIQDIENSLYTSHYYNEATIDNPISLNYNYYISKAIINDFILYSLDTKEVIFGYSEK